MENREYYCDCKFDANTMTDEDALKVVEDYFRETYNVTGFFLPRSFFVVWKCKTVQNVKFIVGTTLNNSIYELTLNGDKNELYVDEYKKINKAILKLDK
jgi:hypothetical protein